MSETKSNLEKLKSVATGSSAWLDKATARRANKKRLDYSFEIALLILRSLRARKMHQSELATILEVSDQYVSKILKGQENLSLETICKIEDALNIDLINIAKPDALYIMRVQSGTGEFNYAIKGKKAEESYTSTLKNIPRLAPLYVQANEQQIDGETIEDTCSQ